MSELGISLFSSRRKKRRVQHLAPSGTADTAVSTAATPSGIASATFRVNAAEVAATAADKLSEELRDVKKAARLTSNGDRNGVKRFSLSKAAEQVKEAAIDPTKDEAVLASEAPAPQEAASLSTPPEQETTGALVQLVDGDDEDQMAGFRHLGVTEWLDRVCSSLGMNRPTAVQRGCIPAILKGKDVIGTAHTGSGKTAAFALPILQKLAQDPFGVFALVLTPTRELAFQLADQFRALGAGMSLQDAVVIGGLDMQQQARALARRPHVVIATPGRLRDLLQNEPDLAKGFARVRFLVLDEADRLLEPTFESELRKIAGVLPPNRQTLLFSATMTKSLVAMQSAALRDAYCFQAYEGLETAQRLREEYLFIPAKVKEVYLAHLLGSMEELGVRSAIVFVGTCRGCHLLNLVLEELGVPCVALHSSKTQGRRLAALDRFKSGGVPILLATDVASRGLDIPSVDLVVNFDLPVLARDYVHRVGRTARAMRQGWALSFVSQYDVELVQKIEALLDHKLSQFSMDEKEVLRGITKVYTARRAAALRMADEDRRQERKGIAPRQRKKKT